MGSASSRDSRPAEAAGPGPEPQPAAESPETATLLEVRGLGVQFGGVAALADVSFDVGSAQTVAIIGPNGAGKSTTLNAVSGLVRDNAHGAIALGGQAILGKSPVAVASAGVGRSFQDPPLVDTETVLENVMLGEHVALGYSMFAQLFRPREARRLEREARERALAALEFVGVAHLRDEAVRGLPYGTRKLIDIARAILAGRRLLLLDEPTSGLDASEQAAVARILTELNRTTTVGILVVEHHMDIVRSVATRVVGLAGGSIVMVGTPAEVLDSAAFRFAIVGGQRPGKEPDGRQPPADGKR